MRLVTFTYQGQTRIGAAENNKIVDLNLAYQEMLKQQGKIRYREIAEAFIPADMKGFLQGGKREPVDCPRCSYICFN